MFDSNDPNERPAADFTPGQHPSPPVQQPPANIKPMPVPPPQSGRVPQIPVPPPAPMPPQPELELTNVTAPQLIPSQSAVGEEVRNKKSKAMLYLASFVGVFGLLGAGLVGAAYAVAYEKLDINNPVLERQISHTVMALPFMPKTPRYILESSTLAHQKVTSHSFDISLAAKSADLASALGLNQIDAKLAGDVNYQDPKNLKIKLDAEITKDFVFKIYKPDDRLYFKVDQIPAALLSVFGVTTTEVQPLFANWILFDMKPLDTEARRELDQNTKEESVTAQYLDESLQNLLNERVLKNTAMSEENLEGIETYRMINSIDNETLDYLVAEFEKKEREKAGLPPKADFADPYGASVQPAKPSEYLQDLKVTSWVEKESYLVRKISVGFKLKNNRSLTPFIPSTELSQAYTQVLGESTEDSVAGTDVVLVTKFSDYGKTFPDETPTEAINAEEFYNRLSAIMASKYGSAFSGPQINARDSRRLSDLKAIQTALELYYNDNNKYPTATSYSALEAPLGKYFTVGLPQDPEAPGKSYVYSGTNGSAYTVCIPMANFESPATAPAPNNKINGQDAYCLRNQQ